MKKLFITIIFSLSFLFVIQAEENPQLIDESAESMSTKLLPRYFNDKFIVNFNGEVESCELHIFSVNGKHVCNQLIALQDEQYIFKTDALKKGVYFYYIVINNQPVIKGKFTKS